jgi:hypothetical protein
MRARLVGVIGVVALLLGVVGCSAASVSTTPTQTAVSPSPSKSVSVPSSANTAGVTLIPVPGYTYIAIPAQVKLPFGLMNITTGSFTVVGRGVDNASGTLIGMIALWQYNPRLTLIMDKRTPSQMLDVLSKPFMSRNAIITDQVLSGSKVRLVRTASASQVVVYMHGGELIAVIALTSPQALNFMSAYLTASGNR